jgi:cytidyltransferase-like protein
MIARGMVFGVFDGLHEGHKFFLREAAARCEELVVVVADSHLVRELKGREPLETDAARKDAIMAFLPHARVISGDQTLGAWQVFSSTRPDKVFLGYDQRAIAAALDELHIQYEYIAPYEPERYKSSLLRAN